MDKQFATRLDSPRHRARRGVFGLAVIGLGGLALLDNLHVFPGALLRTYWPLVFVLWGLGRLAWGRHPGKRLFGVVLVAAGGLMTAYNLGYEDIDLRQWWPVFIILAGVAIALRSVYGRPRASRRRFESSVIDHADEVSVDATFSGIKLQNDSRSFKGGRIEVNFGGLELDLREAVMEAPEATIQVGASFSGIEIRIPRDWQVVTQITTTLGAIEDKTTAPVAPLHRLVLRGETSFGAVEIKN